jgi:uncharacterized protein YbjT (DUF2867 family)
MRRVLVTAALGNVGREVTRECERRGFAVRVAGVREAELAGRFPQHEAARFDFLDRATWPAALAGCDFLFLLRPPPIGDMEATLNPFVDAAYAAGVRHIVFLSVAGAERKSWVPHREVELHLERTGDAWTVLRPGFFAQNLQDAYRRDITEDSRLSDRAARRASPRRRRAGGADRRAASRQARPVDGDIHRRRRRGVAPDRAVGTAF